MYDYSLSKRQIDILEFIRSELNTKGYPPSVREICEGVGLSSTSTVHSHLSTLEKYGYIIKDPTKPRAIALVHDGIYKKMSKKNLNVQYTINSYYVNSSLLETNKAFNKNTIHSIINNNDNIISNSYNITSKESTMNFGQRLKTLRENKQLSRENLASEFEISYSTLSKYETNERFPDKHTLIKLSHYFNVSLDYLLGITNSCDNSVGGTLDIGDLLDNFKHKISSNKILLDGEELTPEDVNSILLAIDMGISHVKYKKIR